MTMTPRLKRLHKSLLSVKTTCSKVLFVTEVYPIHVILIHNGPIDLLELCIKVGYDVNQVDSVGKSPLMIAHANKVRFELLDVLIKAGANVNFIHSIHGHSVLEYAYSNHLLVDYLCKNGANVNVKLHACEVTHLHMCCQRGLEDTVHVLLKYGADPNIKCKAGLTALHHAAYMLNVETMRALIQSGGDVTISTPDGRKPVDYTFVSKIDRLDMLTFLIDVTRPRSENLLIHACLSEGCYHTPEMFRAVIHAGYSPFTTCNTTVKGIVKIRNAFNIIHENQNQVAIDTFKQLYYINTLISVKCAWCNMYKPKLLACSVCRRVKYCSKKCQVADWKNHKPSCGHTLH